VASPHAATHYATTTEAIQTAADIARDADRKEKGKKIRGKEMNQFTITERLGTNALVSKR